MCRAGRGELISISLGALVFWYAMPLLSSTAGFWAFLPALAIVLPLLAAVAVMVLGVVLYRSSFALAKVVLSERAHVLARLSLLFLFVVGFSLDLLAS
jgi:hypothetical protein